MSGAFSDVQRIVLRGTRWRAARHLMLDFGKASPLNFLQALLEEEGGLPTAANVENPDLQFSLGFTRSGLKQAHVPDHVLTCFALKSPAFWAGAKPRAASHLGLTGANAPELWDKKFAHARLHAVLSVHAMKKNCPDMNRFIEKLQTLARKDCIACAELPAAAALDASPGVSSLEEESPKGQWVHFGYRDGLSRIGIEGWTKETAWKDCLPISRHKAGEFVLGHVPDCGADPWVAGPGLRVWPDKVRSFFRNGSFGVLQQIEQDVVAFESYVQNVAKQTGLDIREIKGKLCGRYPDGLPLAVPEDRHNPAADFDYKHDSEGFKCPFGSHVRRMNPRAPILDSKQRLPTEDELAQFPAHFSRPRPLLRRGMPYGLAWKEGEPDDGSRGLIGQFFCASIENQFEHLLGQWADRVPLGSADSGGARDPLIGAHESGDGPFEIPREKRPQDTREGPDPLRLRGLVPFTRTVGAAYLFYPSLKTLNGIADSRLWNQDYKDGKNDTVDEDYRT